MVDRYGRSPNGVVDSQMWMQMDRQAQMDLVDGQMDGVVGSQMWMWMDLVGVWTELVGWAARWIGRKTD